MGGTHACTNLSRQQDACQLHVCVKNVVGLKGNSASPSDAWLLTMTPRTKFENEHVEKAFLKTWVSQDSLPMLEAKLRDSNYATMYFENLFPRHTAINLRQLDYELKVSSLGLRFIQEHKLSPNFVRFYAAAQGCEVANLMPMVRKTLAVDAETATALIVRNQLVSLFPRKEQVGVDAMGVAEYRDEVHPPVTEGLPLDANFARKNLTVDDFPHGVPLKLNVLVNEQLSGLRVQTFHEWLKGAARVNRKELPPEFWVVVFQFICSFYVMDAGLRMTHGDPHFNNAWIEEHPEGAGHFWHFRFHLERYVYAFSTRFRVRLFDFDRAAIEALGPNEERTYRAGSDLTQFVFLLSKTVQDRWESTLAKETVSRLIELLSLPQRRAKNRHADALALATEQPLTTAEVHSRWPKVLDWIEPKHVMFAAVFAAAEAAGESVTVWEEGADIPEEEARKKDVQDFHCSPEQEPAFRAWLLASGVVVGERKEARKAPAGAGSAKPRSVVLVRSGSTEHGERRNVRASRIAPAAGDGSGKPRAVVLVTSGSAQEQEEKEASSDSMPLAELARRQQRRSQQRKVEPVVRRAPRRSRPKPKQQLKPLAQQLGSSDASPPRVRARVAQVVVD